MANKKISELTPLNATPDANDILPLNDTSAGSTFSVRVSELQAATQALASNLTDISTIAQANGTMIASNGTNFVSLGTIDGTGLSAIRADLGLGTAATTATPSEGPFVDGDKTKLDGIEASADVTDTANVTAAGALMDSEVTNLAQVKEFDSADYATAAQGTLADSATQPGDNISTLTNDSNFITSASTDFSSAFFSIVSEATTTRTLSNSDNGKVIVCSNAGQVIVTIPSGLTSGFNCVITQGGTGTVTIAGSGASINGFNNKTATAGQYAVVNVIPVGANAYYVDGDLITAPLVNSYSLDLDGLDDYVGTQANLTVQSASMWIKPDNTITSSSSAQVLMGGDGTNYRVLFLGNATSYVTNEVVGVAYGSGAFGTGSGVTLANTDWHHIFIAWQTSSQSNGGSAGYDFWINGTLQTTGSGAQSGGTPPSSPITLTSMDMGRRQNNTQLYAGLMDEVALWSSDVSSDIATIYNSGVPNNLNDSNNVSTRPFNWWRMGDNDAGTTISDQGSSPQDGTLTNGPTFSTDVP